MSQSQSSQPSHVNNYMLPGAQKTGAFINPPPGFVTGNNNFVFQNSQPPQTSYFQANSASSIDTSLSNNNSILRTDSTNVVANNLYQAVSAAQQNPNNSFYGG